MSIFKNFIITDSEYRISPRIFTGRVILIIFGFIIAYLQIETKIGFIQILWKLCFLILGYTLFIQARKRINDYNGGIETQKIICTLFGVGSILYILEIGYPYSLWMIGIFFIVFCYILAISWPTPGNIRIKNNDYTGEVIWVYWKVFGQLNPFVMLYYFLRNLYNLVLKEKAVEPNETINTENYDNIALPETVQIDNETHKRLSFGKWVLIVINMLILGPIVSVLMIIIFMISFDAFFHTRNPNEYFLIIPLTGLYLYFLIFYKKIIQLKYSWLIAAIHTGTIVWTLYIIFEPVKNM